MKHSKFTSALIILVLISLSCTAKTESNKIVKATVTATHKLSDAVTNAGTLLVSRTGDVAALYSHEKDGSVYQISKDGGATWLPQKYSVPPGSFSPSCSIGLKEGSVIASCGHNIVKRVPFFGGTFLRFTDDFSKYEIFFPVIDIPNVQLTAQEPSPHTWAGPIFDKGKMVQLPNGDILAPLWGRFKGDFTSRAILCKSSDSGRSWKYYSTVAYDADDPNPELPGEFGGYPECSITMLPNGQMLFAARTQSSHLPPDYKPIYLSWSDDLGKTWTKPQPSNPHLINIWPTLMTLDNGVIACQYSRPGFHVVFSIDNGHTWSNKISFEHTSGGMNDMIKTGPNTLVALGGIPGQGTFAYQIKVDLIDDPNPDPFEVKGIVTDQQGKPIENADVELGPNRYTETYEPINTNKIYPLAKTNKKGIFTFKNVKRGEHEITVEADGFTPSWKHVVTESDMQQVSFTLNEGSVLTGKVVDENAKPLAGVCFITESGTEWHSHTDLQGNFPWIIEGEAPEKIKFRLVKKEYTHRDMTLNTSDLQKPITMQLQTFQDPNNIPEIIAVGRYPASIPSIEAEFDDPNWLPSPVIDNFKMQLINDAKPIPIKARFAYDNKYLYAIIKVAPDPNLPLLDEDMLEFCFDPFFQPYQNTEKYEFSFQFAYNLDGRIPGLFGWNCPYPQWHITKDSDGGWTLSTSMWWLQIGKGPHTMYDPAIIGITHTQAIDDKEKMISNPPTAYHYGRLILK